MHGKYVFCPICHDLLTLNNSELNICYRLDCPRCPYYVNISSKIVNRTVIKRDTEDAGNKVIDLKKENERRERTEVICPVCSHTEAYFRQMQTRSADEPMTNFYECTNEDCRHNWRE